MLSPVPAVMVSCRGVQPGDKPNIVTIAWAGTVNSNPPMVLSLIHICNKFEQPEVMRICQKGLLQAKSAIRPGAKPPDARASVPLPVPEPGEMCIRDRYAGLFCRQIFSGA